VSLATPEKLRRLQEALYTKAKQESAYRFYLLYDKVYRADILAHAYAVAKQRGGAPGVDGATFEDIDVVAELNSVLRGWAHYFSHGTRLMAYRVIDDYVAERTRHFLRRRHKVPTRGTRRFPADRIFGELGVFRLRRFHLGSPAHAGV
jgi:hypothetical protein